MYNEHNRSYIAYLSLKWNFEENLNQTWEWIALLGMFGLLETKIRNEFGSYIYLFCFGCFICNSSIRETISPNLKVNNSEMRNSNRAKDMKWVNVDLYPISSSWWNLPCTDWRHVVAPDLLWLERDTSLENEESIYQIDQNIHEEKTAILVIPSINILTVSLTSPSINSASGTQLSNSTSTIFLSNGFWLAVWERGPHQECINGWSFDR